jgi:hypothetical protein
MKKVLFLLISLVLVFSLLSCVKEDVHVLDEDERQIPVYEGMTVSSAAQTSDKETSIRSKSLKKELSIIRQ